MAKSDSVFVLEPNQSFCTSLSLGVNYPRRWPTFFDEDSKSTVYILEAPFVFFGLEVEFDLVSLFEHLISLEKYLEKGPQRPVSLIG